MFYLLYFRNGFIKKFPIENKSVTIGRHQDNDLCLEELFVSKHHARITLHENEIEIEDMQSTNGIFIGSTRVSKARIPLNECFRIGYLKFFLKMGNPEEFALSEKILPLLNTINDAIAGQSFETNRILNLLYSEPLIEILQSGFHLHDSLDFFKYANPILSSSLKKGRLLLLEKQKNNVMILSKWSADKSISIDVDKLLIRHNWFDRPHNSKTIHPQLHICSFPIPDEKKQMALVFLVKKEYPITKKTGEFLQILSMEISVVASLMREDNESENRFPKPPAIVTVNKGMLNLLSQCRKIANSNLFILIEGETGTGKDMLAKYLHCHSQKKRGSFVAINCGAFSDHLLDNELFGHEKGSFTDAAARAQGKLELASGGTLVLDEIGDMPISLQVKLLRAIQEHRFFRIGGTEPVQVDLRIISLTNRNIKEMIKADKFREDLYYRIAHLVMHVPPLRERSNDIIPLINHYMNVFSSECRIHIKGFSASAIKAMEHYDWPGNIRELENEIKALISMSENGDIIGLDRLKHEIREYSPETTAGADEKNDTPSSALADVLSKVRWNKSLAAKELGISRTTLYNKMRKEGLH